MLTRDLFLKNGHTIKNMFTAVVLNDKLIGDKRLCSSHTHFYVLKSIKPLSLLNKLRPPWEFE